MTAVAGAAVVVGVDGSPRGLEAVAVAAAEAARRRRPLRIVHALSWPHLPVPMPPGIAEAPPDTVRQQARTFLTEASGVAGKVAPDVPANTEIVNGRPAVVLTDESRHAYLLVVGERGMSGLVIGSVATHLAAHAACPVLVARGEHRSSGPVIVGVDGSSESTRALEFALEEASLRGTALVALHAWDRNDGTELDSSLPAASELRSGGAQEQRVLAEALAGAGDRYPDVPIRREVVRGNAAALLTERSHRAQMVVVGDRGHSGLTGLVLGSVSQHLIFHADCPTTVVRARPPANP